MYPICVYVYSFLLPNYTDYRPGVTQARRQILKIWALTELIVKVRDWQETRRKTHSETTGHHHKQHEVNKQDEGLVSGRRRYSLQGFPVMWGL